MVAYSETLPAWQPGKAITRSRAESLAVDLMGLGEIGSPVLGDAKYQGLVTSMVPTFERWGQRWLKFASVAAWFANFLRTDSGRVLLPRGVKQLVAVIDTLPDGDWYHHELGSLFTDVLSLCWKHLRGDVEKDADLRKAFLSILACFARGRFQRRCIFGRELLRSSVSHEAALSHSALHPDKHPRSRTVS